MRPARAQGHTTPPHNTSTPKPHGKRQHHSTQGHSLARPTHPRGLAFHPHQPATHPSLYSAQCAHHTHNSHTLLLTREVLLSLCTTLPLLLSLAMQFLARWLQGWGHDNVSTRVQCDPQSSSHSASRTGLHSMLHMEPTHAPRHTHTHARTHAQLARTHHSSSTIRPSKPGPPSHSTIW